MYQALQSNKDAIELAIGEKLGWFIESDSSYARITWDHPVANLSDTSDEYKAQWMAQSLNRLYEVTKVYL